MSDALHQSSEARVSVGVVAIGRNEGERLERCLQSVRQRVAAVVYVDSGSTDSSVAMARALGVEVVQLDGSVPFTAARSRNAGVERLLDIRPDIEFVQVVDGDCEVVLGWIERALDEMRKSGNERFAVVCGRRRERYPEASIYNRVIDIEWDTPIGESKWCGGDALIRLSAFRRVGGYDANVIAGEEPELCVRLRRDGWIVMRIDAEMTLHDAAVTRFGQWWRRSVRSGHAFAEGASMHGRSPERHFVRDVRSNWFWGLILPLAAIAPAWPTRGWSLVLLGGYVLLLARVLVHAWRMRTPAPVRWALFTVLGKFAETVGQMRFVVGRWSGKKSRLIEYKRPSAEVP